MAPQSVSEERRGRENSLRSKIKWKNRGFIVVKREVLGRTGGGEEAMLMWQDLTWRPGGLIFFDALRRNRFCW